MNGSTPNPQMPEPKKCPQCGADLPAGALEGLCPACLLKQGTADDTVSGPQTAFQPPSPADLARHFPQLEIIELIGRGGMGAVYKARQRQLDRLVALKILPPNVGRTTEFAERFTREAKALARLNHPNIVTLYEFGQADGLFYFLMEYVDGVSLRQLLNTGRMAPREALAIVPQICDALQFAHDQGIVHRDIKPENVLLDRKGRVKVADFGVAKIMSAARQPEESGGAVASATPQTEAGRVMGTPQYMAPEQREHPLEVDHRADIYSLGVVFYQMLTGQLPAQRIEPPSKKVFIDVRLDEVVLRALERQPERRYQHASDVKTQVETIAGGPAGATPTHTSTPTNSGDFWQRLRMRLWPPLVGRVESRRVINWPALAMRGLRVVFVGLVFAVILGALIGMQFGDRKGVLAGLACFGFVVVLASFVMTIRILRGFALPLEMLPELQGAAGGFRPASGAARPRRRRPPVVGLRDGRRVINWPVVGIGAAFALYCAMLGGPIIGMFFAFLIVMQILHGYAMPLAMLTELDGAAGTAARTDAASGTGSNAVDNFQTRHLRKIALAIGVALLFALVIRAFFIMPFHVTSDAVTPVVTRGSYVMVFRLAWNFSPGDIIVYCEQGKNLIGRVTKVGYDESFLLIERRGKPPQQVLQSDVIGRVILTTRKSEAQKPVAQASDEGPSRIETAFGNGKEVIIEGYGQKGGSIIFKIGEGRNLGWTCGFANNSPFTARLASHSFLEDLLSTGRIRCIVTDATGVTLLTYNGRTVPRPPFDHGRLVFVHGPVTPEADGSVVVGQYVPENTSLSFPIRVSVSSGSAKPTGRGKEEK